MKKRIVTIALVVALLATCFAGTYAYLMDSESQVNTFTTGKVYITLDEVVVEKDEETGNLVPKIEDEKEVRTSENQEYKLFPGMTVDKDPTITLDEGSEDAWIAAKITLEKYDCYDDGLLRGGIFHVEPVAEGERLYEVVADEKNGTENHPNYVYYIYVTKPMVAKESIVLFEELWIPFSWDNDDMKALDEMKIQVEAYGVQANGFATCQEAMYAAYDDVFPEPTAADENT